MSLDPGTFVIFSENAFWEVKEGRVGGGAMTLGAAVRSNCTVRMTVLRDTRGLVKHGGLISEGSGINVLRHLPMPLLGPRY